MLARTNRELLPAVVVALATGMPFRAARADLPVEDPRMPEAIAAAVAMRDLAHAGRHDVAREPLLVTLARLRREGDDADLRRLATALLAWAPPYPDLPAFGEAIADARRRLAELRRDDAALTLATAHATKGLEFDHVVILGMEAARFPSARAVGEAADPVRAYEEERRLAYVAWTRARRSLTILYDPASPSPFLREAFSDEELGIRTASG